MWDLVYPDSLHFVFVYAGWLVWGVEGLDSIWMVMGTGYWCMWWMWEEGEIYIENMWVKGSKTGWISMSHNWGTSYQAFASLSAQSLSFKFTSYTSKDTIIAWNFIPPNWTVGLTYSSNINFYWSPSTTTTFSYFPFLTTSSYHVFYTSFPLLELF